MTRFFIFCVFVLSAISALHPQTLPICTTTAGRGSEACTSACILCMPTSFTADNSGASPDTAPGFCGVLTNDVWHAFIAGGTGTVTFSIRPSDCTAGNGLQAALYTRCTAPPIACSAGQQGGGQMPLELTAQVTMGSVYYLVVNGRNGDVCNYQFSATPAALLKAPALSLIPYLAGPTNVCPGATVQYAIGSTRGATHYTWTIPPDATINGLPGPGPHVFEKQEGERVEITFGRAAGSVEVQPSNACQNGVIKGLAVMVRPIPTTLLNQSICVTRFPYTLPHGPVINGPGMYNFTETLTNFLGCDSVVSLRLSVTKTAERDLGQISLCGGKRFFLCGRTYDTTGVYGVVLMGPAGAETKLLIIE